MKIDISKALKHVGNELKIDEKGSIKFEDNSLILSGPVSIKAKVINTGETVLIEGKIKSKVKLECCRCLKSFDFAIETEIEEEYSKKPLKPKRASKNQEIELSEDDFIFPISDDNEIDLDESIRQNIITDLPIKPLCKKSCKGIHNNVSKKAKLEDPRLTSLKDIKGKLVKK